MSSSFREMVEADCSVLLIRALLNKTLVAFGDDGLGKYGRSTYPKTFTVRDMDVDVILDDDGSPSCVATLYLTGYDAADVGHIYTDQNFLISVRSALKADHIDPSCIEYSELCLQGDSFVTFDVDVKLLLDWA